MSIVPDDPGRERHDETFNSVVSALQRHGAIASALRDAGWVVIAYSPSELNRAAA
jgi:hypothetical protein